MPLTYLNSHYIISRASFKTDCDSHLCLKEPTASRNCIKPVQNTRQIRWKPNRATQGFGKAFYQAWVEGHCDVEALWGLEGKGGVKQVKQTNEDTRRKRERIEKQESAWLEAGDRELTEHQITMLMQFGGAGWYKCSVLGMALWVKVPVVQARGPEFNPQSPTFFFLRKKGALKYTCNFSTRRRQSGPWGYLTSQPSLCSELQTNERPYLNKQGAWLVRQDTQGCSPASTPT